MPRTANDHETAASAPDDTLEASVEAAGAAREAALDARGKDRLRVGVVHTPPALARPLVAALDRALIRRLGLRHGLASPEAALIDPAVGTGAFLAAALSVAARRRASPAEVVGFDVDGDAVHTAREALDPPLTSAGWPLRLEVLDALSCDPASVVSAPLRVVFGNPPWSVRRTAASPRVDGLLEDFRRDARGERLPERRLGVLKDAYVRFIRWGAEVVRLAPGGGALAFFTNASYLDGPLHRAMRAALLRFFDGVDVVDLGGSALLGRGRETDENVFGVRPAVAMIVAHRRPGAQLSLGRLRVARLMGTRAQKLEALPGAVPSPLKPRGPHGVWRRLPPSDERYAEFVSLGDLFPFHAEGVQTNRDKAMIATSRAELMERMRAFVAGAPLPELAALEQPKAHYDPEVARSRVADALARGVDPEPLAYRPFDRRFFYPVTPACHRPRTKLIEAMRRSDFGLVTVRKDRGDLGWAFVGAVGEIADSSFLSSRSSCRTRVFPTRAPGGEANLDLAVASALLGGVSPDVDELLRYALAVLASESYRTLAGGALGLELPRLPPPPSPTLYRRVVDAGDALLGAFLEPGEPRSGRALRVGHHMLEDAPRALVEAFERAEDAVVPVVGRERG